MNSIVAVGMRTVVAVIICVVVLLSTRMWDRSDESAWRKLLVVLLPVLIFAFMDIVTDSASLPWRILKVVDTANWTFSLFILPIALLRLSSAQTRAFFSARPEKPRLRGMVVAGSWIVLVINLTRVRLEQHEVSIEELLVSWRVSWIFFVGSAFIGPVFEEWYARGVLWAMFPERTSTVVRALAIAVICAAYHWPWYPNLYGSEVATMTSLFITSVVVGYIRGEAGIRWSMVMHIIHNAMYLTRAFAY